MKLVLNENRKKIQSVKKNPQANVSPPFLLPKPAEGIAHKLTSAFTRMEPYFYFFTPVSMKLACLSEQGS